MADGSENGRGPQEPVDWELARKRSADALWGIYIGACRIHRDMKTGNGGPNQRLKNP